MNLLKVKSVKTFAKNYIQRLNQQKKNRVPLYNVYIYRISYYYETIHPWNSSFKKSLIFNRFISCLIQMSK
jgi:hypothetical protein